MVESSHRLTLPYKFSFKRKYNEVTRVIVRVLIGKISLALELIQFDS